MFRGADARSIARAMAVLLVFNAFFGAFHSGAMARTATGAFTLCSTEGAVRPRDDSPQDPADAEDMSCCVLGCGPLPAALAAEPALLAAPTYAASRIPPLLFDKVISDLRRVGIASPRGPPILA
jgi:hypothetical protein